MPLLIDMKPGDKIIINGAVIESAGGHSKLMVHNQATILRGREVMTEQDVCTPAARVYFALQCAYVFPANESEYLASFNNLLNEYQEACPSSQPIADTIRGLVAEHQLYKALRASQALLTHEFQLAQAVNAHLQSQLNGQEPER
jgi:flagellar protein FlbT